MIKKLTTLFCIFSVLIVNGQYSEKKFEQLYTDVTISKKTNSTIENNIEEVKSWFENKELQTDEQKLKGYLIIANLYNFAGERPEALRYADKGRTLAQNARQFLWEARFLGFTSTIYRQTNMFALGEEYLERAVTAAVKAPQAEELYRFKANAYHELAHYASISKNFDKALSQIRLGTWWAKKIQGSKRDFYIATNYQYTGLLFNQMALPDSALVYLQRSRELTEHSTDINTKTLQNYVNNYIGEAYLMKNELGDARKFLDKVLRDSEQFRTTDLNYEVYKNLLTYYNTRGNLDSIKIFKHKTDSLNALINKNTANTINNVTNSLSQQNKELQKKTEFNYWYVIIILFIFLIIFLTIRKNKGKQKAVKLPEIIPANVKTEELNIAKETLEGLEKKIKHFEEHHQYLDPNISSTVLANQFETNTKYITYVIRKLYDLDFNTYISTLRINHICKLLINDPKYRQYKISYLAENAGFSSHSKFAATFKKIKGIPPSEFISNLENS